MNTRLIVAIAIVGGFAAGCTFIVGSKFSDTDGYKQNVSPGDTAIEDACKLPPPSSKVATTCGDCIVKNCGAEVDYACGRTDKKEKDYFRRTQNCSTGFNRFNSYSCGSFENTDAGTIANPANETEHGQNLDVCIRDSCVKGGGSIPPCRQCIPSVTSGSDSYVLGAGECGKCIADACKQELADCCQESDRVDDIAYCAAPQVSGNRARCLRAFDAPDGGLKADAGACEQRILNCLSGCKTTCSNSPN